MASFFGLLITLFLGLAGWRIQLIGKRRTELAEEALLAFTVAVDAIRAIRSPFSGSHELDSLRREMEIAESAPIPGQDYQITMKRIRDRQDIFSNLRRLQILCGFHFGSEATGSFTELHNVFHELAATASVGAMGSNEGHKAPEEQEFDRRARDTIWGLRGEADDLNNRITLAQKQLERVLAPHLRADAALLPIALHWRASIARIKASRVSSATSRDGERKQ